MSCDALETELTGFHFGTLDPDTRLRVEEHLLGCPACLRAFLDLKRAIEETDDLPGPSPASRARLRQAVSDAVRGARPGPVWAWWERPLAVGFAMAAVALSLGAMRAVASSPGTMPRGASVGEREGAPPRTDVDGSPSSHQSWPP